MTKGGKAALLLLLLCFFSQIIVAQQKAPSWLDIGYIPLENSYIKVFCGGIAETEAQAKELSTIEIIKDRDLYTGGAYQWDNDFIIEKESGHIIVKAHILDEYSEKHAKGYKVYLLVQTATHPQRTLDAVYVGNNYPFSARVFVPGLAQIYKGTPGKGAFFITGEVLFIGGIVTTEFMRVNYSQQVAQTHKMSDKKKFAQKARICTITRNACIGGAVALYLWNIIDGAVAKGRTYVAKDGKMLSFSPYYTTESTGIALSIRF